MGLNRPATAGSDERDPGASASPKRTSAWFAAPDGRPENRGTLDSPWDIASALTNSWRIGPGDTLYLRGGTYRYTKRTPGSRGFFIRLKGAKDAPVTVKPYRDEHVTIDGGLQSWDASPCHDLVISNLEILVSENLTEPRFSAFRGSDPPRDLKRPWGGIDFRSGTNIQIVNNIIHDNMQGIGLWGQIRGDCRICGNVVYRNGWIGPDRHHGHGVYTQNASDGWRRIDDNILIDNYSLNLQAYGSRAAFTNNIEFSRNIFCGGPNTDDGGVLLGGNNASHHLRVHDNIGALSSLRVGYVNGGDDVVVRNNTIWGAFSTMRFTHFVRVGNFWWTPGFTGPRSEAKDGDLIGIDTKVPAAPVTFLNLNADDPARANLVILNFPRRKEASIDVAKFLSPGDGYRLFDPTNLFGRPIAEGSYSGRPLAIPVNDDFAIYILRRDRKKSAGR